MAHEKQYTAKQVTDAVLTKVSEVLKGYESLKKSEKTWNSPKLGTQAPHRHQDEIDEPHITGEHRVREQEDPHKNPKEKAEGNNAPSGQKPEMAVEYNKQPLKKSAISGMHKVEYHSKGVRSPISSDLKSGTSVAGLKVRGSQNVTGPNTKEAKAKTAARWIGGAKENSKNNLKELRSMPKPNLPKSEEGMEKKEEKPSKDKFGQHVRQHLIDKVHHSLKEMGRKDHEVSPNSFHAHAHAIGIKNLHGHEIVHGADTYKCEKSESLAKDFGSNFAQAATTPGAITPAKIQQGARSIGAPKPSPTPAAKCEKAEDLEKDGSIQSGIAAAGGGGNTPINSGVASSLGGAFGKAEKNPDEKEDAKLGEKVEHDVERHMEENKEAEKEEGHKMVKTEFQAAKVSGVSKLAKFLEVKKSEQLKKS